MRYILVKGTTVIDWNDETPYEYSENDINGVPFELEDMGEDFLDQEIPEDQEPHWDGMRWWFQEHQTTLEEVVEITENHSENIDINTQDIEDIILLLAEVLGTEEAEEEE